MTRLAIGLTDRLVRDSHEYRFEGRRGSELDFVCYRNGIRLVLTDAEVSEGVASGTYRLIQSASTTATSAPPVSGDDFSMLPAHKKASARRRYAYLKGLESRGITSLSVPAVTTAVAEIAIEIGDERPPHWTSIWRWQNKTGDRVTLSKLSDNDRAKGNRESRLAPEVRAIVSQVIEIRYLTRECISLTSLHDFVVAEIDLVNQERAEKLKAPSYQAVREAVRALNPRDVLEARKGKRIADLKFNPVRLQKDPEAPLDLVEIDHTKADMFVVDDDTLLPIGRPWITLAMDRCTRMPFGIYVGYEPPSVHSVMQCLRNGMLPKTYVRRLVAEGRWKIQNDWPVFGRPRELLVDLGLEFVGHDLEDFAGEVGINLRLSPRKSPWYKGAIERYLGTLNRQLLHEQRGTTFSNVLARDDYNPAENAVVPFQMLLEIVHRWLLDIYAVRKHEGLGDVPSRAWAELTERFPVPPIADLAELDQLFGRIEDRKLQRTGIRFEDIHYVSDELVAWLADPDFLRRAPQCEVKFRYDPSNLGEIRVKDPRTGRYLSVPPAPKFAGYVRDLSIWQHRRIVVYRRERMNGSVDARGLAQAKREISALVEAAWTNRRAATKTRQRLARFVGIGRTAMAGDSTATSPAGLLGSASSRSHLDPLPALASVATDDPLSIPADRPRAHAAASRSGPKRSDETKVVSPGGSLLRRLAAEAPINSDPAADDAADVYAELDIHVTRSPAGGA